MAEPIITLLENWDETHTLTRDEAIAILELPDEQLPQLIETAYVLRTKYTREKGEHSAAHKCTERQLFAELCILRTVVRIECADRKVPPGFR